MKYSTETAKQNLMMDTSKGRMAKHAIGEHEFQAFGKSGSSAQSGANEHVRQR